MNALTWIIRIILAAYVTIFLFEDVAELSSIGVENTNSGNWEKYTIHFFFVLLFALRIFFNTGSRRILRVGINSAALGTIIWLLYYVFVNMADQQWGFSLFLIVPLYTMPFWLLAIELQLTLRNEKSNA